MSDLDWIIEYDVLPPDDSAWQQPGPPDNRPRRRLPRWAWLLIGLGVVALATLAILWRLGGDESPLPDPDPALARLEAAVELEAAVLQNGDREIYDRLQDSDTRRRNFQPPPDRWFAELDRAAGPVEVVDLKPLGETSARAEVRLIWDGRPYRLTWFYRREGDQWLHTDWAAHDLGPDERLTGPHGQVRYASADADQARALLASLESLVDQLCGLLPCPPEPFTVTVKLDPFSQTYTANAFGDLSYSVASPVRIRWPWDGQPEPVVLASLGRRLAFDLVARPAIRRLEGENRTALAAGTYWLVHRLLGLPAPPTTRWLDDAARRDGLEASAAYLKALRDNVPLFQALTESFQPATVAAVTGLPDYYGWLALIEAPREMLNPPYLPGVSRSTPREELLAEYLNWGAEPWAPAEETYARCAPQVQTVRYLGDWAIATVPGVDTWGPLFTFQRQGSTYVARAPDASLLGEIRTRTAGRFTLIYWEVDEPFADPILDNLNETLEAVSANFSLSPDRDYSVAVAAALASWDRPIEADLTITSPTLGVHTYPPGWDREIETAWAVVVGVLARVFEAERFPETRILMLLGVLFWQMEDLGYDVTPMLETLADANGNLGWRPPTDPDDGTWRPLADLWETPEAINAPADAAFFLEVPRLVVDYIVERYGADKLPLLMEQLVSAETVDQWILAVTGEESDRFETAWRVWVVDRWRAG